MIHSELGLITSDNMHYIDMVAPVLGRVALGQSAVLPMFLEFSIPSLKIQRRLALHVKPEAVEDTILKLSCCVETLQESLDDCVLEEEVAGLIPEEDIIRDFKHWEALVDEWKDHSVKYMNKLLLQLAKAEERAKAAEARHDAAPNVVLGKSSSAHSGHLKPATRARSSAAKTTVSTSLSVNSRRNSSRSTPAETEVSPMTSYRAVASLDSLPSATSSCCHPGASSSSVQGIKKAVKKVGKYGSNGSGESTDALGASDTGVWMNLGPMRSEVSYVQGTTTPGGSPRASRQEASAPSSRKGSHVHSGLFAQHFGREGSGSTRQQKESEGSAAMHQARTRGKSLPPALQSGLAWASSVRQRLSSRVAGAMKR
mmetsp:Transcript_21640/g.64477  ORF Transcript_21640/g.64477 Transcript_21640/m.64477 type:complete len:370 (-) Transcript_21640:43-1152(-)